MNKMFITEFIVAQNKVGVNMKSDKKILLAFILNLFFSIVEFIGGAITGSVAIISDSVHDFGDSLSIGLSFFLEKTSKKKPDKTHTYGYLRYSVLGSLITTLILIIGSVFVIINAVDRIIHPVQINYNGMIILGIIGVAVNFLASYFTSGGKSLNQRSVSLHMLEDVLGWTVVLVGAIIMKFTDITYIDPIMSMGVALFIMIHSVKNLRFIGDIFFEKTPGNIDYDEITEHLMHIDGVKDVHHLHIRSVDGFNHIATVHIVTDRNGEEIKNAVRNELSEHKIVHSTIEIEGCDECCHEKICLLKADEDGDHHGHHHHGHHH